MNMFKTIMEVLGYATTVLVVLTFLAGLYAWFRGIFPAILRLGKGLAKRKIAVFAKGDRLTSTRSLLLDSKLFNRKNIVEVTSSIEIGRAEDASVFLVFWHDWKDNIDQVLAHKKDNTALVVYAPQELGLIAGEHLKRISEVRNSTVTNFRGRLLIDLLVSMITTGYI